MEGRGDFSQTPMTLGLSQGRRGSFRLSPAAPAADTVTQKYQLKCLRAAVRPYPHTQPVLPTNNPESHSVITSEKSVSLQQCTASHKGHHVCMCLRSEHMAGDAKPY